MAERKEHPHAALVRQGYEAFSRGDIDTLRSLMTGDVAHHLPGEHQLSGDYKGFDAVSDLYRRLGEESDGTLRVELQRLCVDGRGHVMSVHRITAQRRGMGLDQHGGIVFRIVGEKISDLDEFTADIDVDNEFWGGRAA